jgi:hypothetical protein
MIDFFNILSKKFLLKLFELWILNKLEWERIKNMLLEILTRF